MFDAELFMLEAFRTAVLFQTHVFIIDYWKGPERKNGCGAKDFAEACEYINSNSTKFGIHKDHISVGGVGPGAWVVLGAMKQLIKRKNIDIVEAAFYVCPVVDDTLSQTKENELA